MSQNFEARGDHYRALATSLCQLARQAAFPSVRRRLIDLAKRYDRMATEGDAVTVDPYQEMDGPA